MKTPFLPLAFDTDVIPLTTDYGFVVTDGGVDMVIDSLTIDSSDVVITLSTAPVGACEVRYAIDNMAAGITINGGATGNLRDSDDRSITLDGVSRPLYNFAPHFELSVIALGE